MAGYDPSLDKELFKKSIEFERSVIDVKIMSYNEGVSKVQIARQSRKADGSLGFAKLGRLTKEELEKVLPALQEALGQL